MMRPSDIGNVESVVGKPSTLTIAWNSFVAYVLDITIEAYEKMQKELRPKKSDHEQWLSYRFAHDYMIPVANSKPLRLRIDTEVQSLNEKMKLQIKSGQSHILEAKRIDIRLVHSHEDNYDKVYFAWECKKIVDKEIDEKNEGLITKYVTDGIHRFCDGEYSSNVSNAGMIGYILDGDADVIVKQINASIISPKRTKNRPLPKQEQIEPSTIKKFNRVYESIHARNGNSPIKLYHLFFTFDWDIE